MYVNPDPDSYPWSGLGTWYGVDYPFLSLLLDKSRQIGNIVYNIVDRCEEIKYFRYLFGGFPVTITLFLGLATKK